MVHVHVHVRKGLDSRLPHCAFTFVTVMLITIKAMKSKDMIRTR